MIRLKKLPQNIHQKIDLLIYLLRKERNIIFAYLFGGLLKDSLNPLSDVDIAIFVKDIKRLDYLELFGRITDILGSDELDLIILNTSPVTLAGRILQNRKLLIDKNPFFRHKYESITLRKYFDFTIKEKAILKERYGFG